MWAEAEANEKAKIVRIAAEAGGRAKTEAAERVRAWARAEEKGKVDIDRFSAQASKKANDEAEER